MASIQPAGISAAQIALTLLRTEPPSKAAGGEVKTDLPAAPPLDASSRSVVSPRTSGAMVSLSSLGLAEGSTAEEITRAIFDRVKSYRTPAEVAEAMANTPTEDVAKIKALGAAGGVRRETVHLDDATFRKFVDASLASALVLTDKEDKWGVKVALLNGTTRIIRSSEVPEANLSSFTYDLYDSTGAHCGGVGGSTINHAYFEQFRIDNPDMYISTGAVFDNSYIIVWPKPKESQLK